MTGKLSAAQLAARLPDESNEGPTQLADRYPQIDAPLRVEPPPSMKAPIRKDAPSRDSHIRRSAFAPAAATIKRDVLQALGAVDDAATFLDPSTKEGKKLRSLDRAVPDPAARGPFDTAVSNFRHLAFSSRRAGRRETEAQAYFSIGVMHDNEGQFDEALRAYGQFLQVARELSLIHI